MEQNLFGINESVFIADTDKTHYPRLNQDIHVDLAIIGGGIVGITLAYLLKHSGQKVILLEKNRIALGMSARNMSQLTIQENLIYNQLMHSKSPGKAKKYADASKEAVTFVKELIKREHIDCDLVDMPSYIYTVEEDSVRKIKNELEACKRLGVELEYKQELPMNLPVKAALKWKEAALFQPRKYLLRLAEDFILAGGKIYEETCVIAARSRDKEAEGNLVLKLQNNNRLKMDQKEEILLVTEAGPYVYAKKVVITCRLAKEEKRIFFFPKTESRHCKLIAVKVKADDLPRGSFNSIDKSRHFIRPIYEKKLVLIGGKEEELEEPSCKISEFKALGELAEKLFRVSELEYHWLVQEDITFDGLPYAGYLYESEYLPIYGAVGFNENEIVKGTASALLLRDQLLMDKSEYEDLFNPKRTGKYLF